MINSRWFPLKRLKNHIFMPCRRLGLNIHLENGHIFVDFRLVSMLSCEIISYTMLLLIGIKKKGNMVAGYA